MVHVDSDVDSEERKVATEAIATLIHIKSTLSELLLKPTGVPPEIISLFLYRRDEATGRTLSKRQIAPLILNALEGRADYHRIVRSIVRTAAQWTKFDLADNEFQARATVQKARAVLGIVEAMESQEREQRDFLRKQAHQQQRHEHAQELRKHSNLLLAMFDDMEAHVEPRPRGYMLEDLCNRLFDLHGIPVEQSFRRNGQSEQIDGAFKIEGWYYIVECRWRKTVADTQDLDGLLGKVNRSGKQTMGLFLSIYGWSRHVIPMLQQNVSKSIILMEGHDLRSVLNGPLDLREFILAKAARLNLHSHPFLGVREYLEVRSRGNQTHAQ